MDKRRAAWLYSSITFNSNVNWRETMTKKIRWIAGILIALLTVTVVQAQMASTNYFPIIHKAEPATATPTTTATPTVTPTATAEPDQVVIDDVVNGNTPNDLDDEYVEITNYSDDDVDMSGWRLRDESGPPNPNIFTFPNGFVLDSGDTVRVWSKSGTNTATNLYWGSSEPIWENGGECAILRDEDNQRVDQFCYRP
jgi:hypothetical protein